MFKLSEISSKELLTLIYSKNRTIIDIRTVNSYNGWMELGEPREGHIRRAVSIPFQWIFHPLWDTVLQRKNLRKNHTVVIYGINRKEIDVTAEKLHKTGFTDVRVYYHFIDEWCRNDVYPMEYLYRYKQLVSADWLKELMEKGKTDGSNNENYIICHCHYQNRESYLKRHIPGAIELNTDWLESPATWNRRSPLELKAALESMGIGRNSTVILYGEDSSRKHNNKYDEKNFGQLASFRCALILLYSGVKDVKILNGGFNSWMESGFTVSTGKSIPSPIDNFGVSVPFNPQLFIDQSDAKEYLSHREKSLISIRSWPEYIGEKSGYSYISRKGRIPGALFSNCGSDSYHMENYRNIDQTCREYGAVKKMWCQSGILRRGTKAFYCGTGWKASEAWFNAYLMGWEEISVYDGGWFEWSNNVENPIERGIPSDSHRNNAFYDFDFMSTGRLLKPISNVKAIPNHPV
ncbi:MAG: hypothetical protein JEY91_12325 [Spirochaetaceae bacterium]|nr:hypothetical protein [Spirochaetaceae bacterium]